MRMEGEDGGRDGEGEDGEGEDGGRDGDPG